MMNGWPSLKLAISTSVDPEGEALILKQALSAIGCHQSERRLRSV